MPPSVGFADECNILDPERCGSLIDGLNRGRLVLVNHSLSRRPPVLPAIWIDPTLRTVFEAAGTNAHRLASGSDGWAERLGDDAMISYKNDVVLLELIEGLEKWCSLAGWAPARLFTRFLPLKNDERISPVLHRGDANLSLSTVVTEEGVRYGLDFAAGYSHGLFLDQRVNRTKARSLRPKRVLNTFAYTCSFSVVAALAGAETVSVDLSRKSLDRGKQNFALNGISERGHRFIADDTLELLPSLYSQGERFDMIILDPPTFSRGNKGRLWQVEQHFEDLLCAALDVTQPKCAILLSTNCTKLNSAALEKMARFCLKSRHRAADFPRLAPSVDFPAGHGASTLWMLVR
jgi:23S rRNA (cytosine1962-C5)-methyltransferase